MLRRTSQSNYKNCHTDTNTDTTLYRYTHARTGTTGEATRRENNPASIILFFCFSFGRSIRSFASLALIFLRSKQHTTQNTYTQHRPKLTNNHRTETCETVERYAHASLLTSSTAREMMQTSSNQCNQSYRNQRKTGENKASEHHRHRTSL
jgi:hypothetical protein